MKTTLNKIREHNPCADGWGKLLRHLGKTSADDEPLTILTILDSNGLDDALWCLRAVEGHEKEMRLYAVWCARQMQHLMTDPRSLNALDVAERYANGNATGEELDAASAAARAAASAAARATSAAARATSEAAASAASAAAWAADSPDAWAASKAAAWAAWAAARNVSNAAVCAAQEVEFRRMIMEVGK